MPANCRVAKAKTEDDPTDPLWPETESTVGSPAIASSLGRPVHILPMPFFQRQQRPQLPIVIALPGLMSVNQTLDHVGLPQSPLPRPPAEQDIAHRRHVPPQPGAQRDAKAMLLRRSMIASGKMPRAISLRMNLAVRALELEVEGNRRGLLDQFVIQERRARL